jgi:hypothetical protein
MYGLRTVLRVCVCMVLGLGLGGYSRRDEVRYDTMRKTKQNANWDRWDRWGDKAIKPLVRGVRMVRFTTKKKTSPTQYVELSI